MVCGHNGAIHLEIRILVTSGFVEPPLERELLMEKPWRFWRRSAPSTGQLARYFQAGLGSSHSELGQVQLSHQVFSVDGGGKDAQSYNTMVKSNF
jgi:hypothetical protein